MYWRTTDGKFLIPGREEAVLDFASVALPDGTPVSRSSEFYLATTTGDVPHVYSLPIPYSIEDTLGITNIHVVYGDSLLAIHWSEDYGRDGPEIKTEAALSGLQPVDRPALPFDAASVIEDYKITERDVPLLRQDAWSRAVALRSLREHGIKWALAQIERLAGEDEDTDPTNDRADPADDPAYLHDIAISVALEIYKRHGVTDEDIKRLTYALGVPGHNNPGATAEILAGLGKPGREALVRALRHELASVRAAAATALGDIESG